MARQARVVFPGLPIYVMVRGAAHLTVFQSDEAKRDYLAWLRSAASQYRLAIHGYVLLSNEFHLLATSADETSLARTMQSLGRRFTQYFHKNNADGGHGSIWDGRYRSSPVDPQNYFLISQRHIETLPVEKGLVTKPEDYPWSSYKIHIGKEPNYGLTDAASFWNLGNTPFERQMNWKTFVEEGNTKAEKEVITNSLMSKKFIGTNDFLVGQRLIEVGRPTKRGRPKTVQNS